MRSSFNDESWKKIMQTFKNIPSQKKTFWWCSSERFLRPRGISFTLNQVPVYLTSFKNQIWYMFFRVLAVYKLYIKSTYCKDMYFSSRAIHGTGKGSNVVPLPTRQKMPRTPPTPPPLKICCIFIFHHKKLYYHTILLKKHELYVGILNVNKIFVVILV